MKRIVFKYLIFCLSLFLFTQCEKDNSLVNTTKNAEIIDFIPEKCYCCWGWIIKAGSDTIKADQLPNQDIIGHEINSPIKVTIEIGEKTIVCSSSPFYKFDYYEIKKLILND
ncbi:MAG: hypothetical protein GH151_08810 [Bacteroidetes bacterium]|nr:hypothetical protein [Bacteroidota bacterium]